MYNKDDNQLFFINQQFNVYLKYQIQYQVYQVFYMMIQVFFIFVWCVVIEQEWVQVVNQCIPFSIEYKNIYYNKLTVKQMKTTLLTNLISQIQTLKQLQLPACPSHITSASTNTQQPYKNPSQITQHPLINIHTSTLLQQHLKTLTITNEYNKLLNKIHKIIDINYDIFQQQQIEYEQAIYQLQKNIYQKQQKIKQLYSQKQQHIKQLQEYRNILLQKQQQIHTLLDNIDNNYKYIQENKQQNYHRQKNIQNNRIQIQGLKYHKRQRSQLCNTLQKQNIGLKIENNRILEENVQLHGYIGELKEYIERMQADMASHNIRSPRILNQFVGGNSVDGDKQLGDNYQNNSIDEESPSNGVIDGINCDQFYQTFTISNRMSNTDHSFHTKSKRVKYRQSIDSRYSKISAGINNRRQGMPLRQVLNISGQTSHYFNFRTKQRLQESNADIRKGMSNNLSNQNQNNQTQNDMNSVNVVKTQTKQINMKQIKQFQVQANQTSIKLASTATMTDNFRMIKCCEESQNGISISQSSSNTNYFPVIDPYYSFFVLTIQCLKMNWKDLNQVANICLKDQYRKVISEGIPMNKWNQYLRKLLAFKVQAQRMI